LTYNHDFAELNECFKKEESGDAKKPRAWISHTSIIPRALFSRQNPTWFA